MIPIPRNLEHSRRRARLREAVLFELARERVMTASEIAAATGIRPSRVLGILVGDGKEYAHDLALVAQGAATTHETFAALTFAITPEGAAEVDRLQRAEIRHVGPPGSTWAHMA